MAEKYPEFRRNDLHRISRFYSYLQAPFILLRFTGGWASAGLCHILVKVTMIGHASGTPIPKWRRQLLVRISYCVARTILAI